MSELKKQLPLSCQNKKFIEVLEEIHNETGEDILNDLILLNASIQNSKNMVKICKSIIDIVLTNKKALELQKIEKQKNDIKKQYLKSEQQQAEDILERIYYAITLYQIKKQEMNKIKERRKSVNGGEENASKYRNDGTFGLALSGGGIRSATFNLGLLQALQRCEILKDIDYLSTVSGGGYIGSSLTWFMSQNGKFPFSTTRVNSNQEGGNMISHLRDHGSYLTPGDGLSIWSFFAALLSAMFKNIVIISLLFITIFVLLTIPFTSFVGIIIGLVLLVVLIALPLKEALKLKIENNKKVPYLAASIIIFTWFFYKFLFPLNQSNGFTFILAIGFFYLMLLALYTFMDIKKSYSFLNERNWKVIQGNLLMYSSFFILLGLITYFSNDLHLIPLSQISFQNYFNDLFISLFSGSSGLIIILSSLKKIANNRYKSILLFIGINLLVAGLIWIYYISAVYLHSIMFIEIENNLPIFSSFYTMILAISAFTILFLIYRYMDLMDVNYASMHRYYKNRLKEAFMPSVNNFETNHSYLHDLVTEQTPYHIINTTVNTSNSKKVKLKGRGGDNFIFSPLVSGSSATGYIETQTYEGGTIDLATAMTISGAAVSPHTSIVISKAISFLLTLFNLRLGYWIKSPSYSENKQNFDSVGFYHFSMIFRELFGKALDETKKYLLLTDGGHFENLALYELVRRKCRYIIVSDAGADPDRTFGDLGRVIERVRVDFGAEIDINTIPMHPKGKKRLSNQGFIHGTIKYKDGKVAHLIYLNTVMLRDLPEDLYTYAKTNHQFPDQSTIDQFFDEKQFEAYRELGYQIGYRMCKEMSHSNFRQIFNIK